MPPDLPLQSLPIAASTQGGGSVSVHTKGLPPPETSPGPQPLSTRKMSFGEPRASQEAGAQGLGPRNLDFSLCLSRRL